MKKSNQSCFYSVFFVICWLVTNLSLAKEIEPKSDSFMAYFDFIGSLRTGTGASKGGKTQAKFQAPGATASYRLGNEPDTNLEAGTFFSFPLNNEKTKRLEFGYLGAAYQLHGSEGNFFDETNTAEAYIQLKKIFHPDLDVWFGRRFYDRKDIHMNDHFWLNTGQGANYGGGIALDTSNGKLKLAMFELKDDDNSKATDIHSQSYEVRLLDIKLQEQHQLNLFTEYVHRRGGELLIVSGKPFTTKTENGFGLAAWVDSQLADNITNTAAVIYRQGAAFRQSSFNANPVREDQGFDLDEAHYWEFNNNFLFDGDQFSISWATVIRSEDRGTANYSDIHWYSTGVRPIFYLTERFNIAFEAGIDYVDNEVLDVKGQLSKFTLALQHSKGRGYFSRPRVRLFVTQAYWSDDFRGLIGIEPDEAPYANDTDGFTIGLQFESWW
jgi:maltoporin